MDVVRLPSSPGWLPEAMASLRICTGSMAAVLCSTSASESAASTAQGVGDGARSGIVVVDLLGLSCCVLQRQPACCVGKAGVWGQQREYMLSKRACRQAGEHSAGDDGTRTDGEKEEDCKELGRGAPPACPSTSTMPHDVITRDTRQAAAHCDILEASAVLPGCS